LRLNKPAPALKKFLAKTFDIRDGEYQRVLLMQLNIFLIIFVLLIIKPVVNAQFLSKVGVDELPVVFLLVAITAMAVSTLYSRALNWRSVSSLTALTLGVSILGLLTMAVLLHLQVAQHLILYLLYIGVAIFGVMTTSQFWIMANLALDGREAKRLFGFIGVGPIAGGVAGGYATSLMAPHLSSSALLIVAAMLLSICIPLNSWIWRKHIKPLNQFQRQKRLRGFGDHPLKLIYKSKHLSYLALLVGLGVVVTKLVDFQFSSVASVAYPDPDELTSFLAFWFSTFNVVSLIIQLFLTRRIVGTYGVGSSLYALPGGVLVGSVLLLFAPVLWAGVFTKLWEVSVKQSINKSATELLALPIPISVKSQTKSFIDVFVDMAATGVGGILLIIVIGGLDLSIRAVSIMTIAILGIWFWVALKVRKEYILSFKAKLSQADQKASRPLPNLGTTSVLNGLRRALETGTEKQIIYVLKKVEEIPDKRLFDDVSKFLSHESTEVRLSALACIYHLNQSVDIEILNQLIEDADDEVKYRAFAQIFRQSNEDRISLIERYLLDENPRISGAALLALAEDSRNNPEMKRMLRLEKRMLEKAEYSEIAESVEERQLFRLIVIRAIGKANVASLYPRLANGLQDSERKIELAAIKAAGETLNEQFIPTLTNKLLVKETRKAAQDALLNYGERIIPFLEEMAVDLRMNGQVIALIPSVLERMDSQKAVDALLRLLNVADVNLRLESLRALNTIQKGFPHLKMRKDAIIEHIIEETSQYRSVVGILHQQAEIVKEEEHLQVKEARQDLQALLERRIDGSLERIFRLLGLRYPPDDVITAYNGILSVDPSTRSNSIDFLDNLLEPNLKRALLPVAETAITESLSSEVIRGLQIKTMDETQGLNILLEGRDPRLKLAVFRLIEAIGRKEYVELIKPFQESPVEKVREQAIRIVASFEQPNS
jgi:AAA family ATP:ADP antiporter